MEKNICVAGGDKEFIGASPFQEVIAEGFMAECYRGIQVVGFEFEERAHGPANDILHNVNLFAKYPSDLGSRQWSSRPSNDDLENGHDDLFIMSQCAITRLD